MDKSDFVVTGTTAGAHGQPDGLTYAVKPDGTVLFHDRPRAIYGACRLALNLEAIRAMAEDEADFWDEDAEEVFSDEVHRGAKGRIREAYIAPEWDNERGGYRYETGYNCEPEASHL